MIAQDNQPQNQLLGPMNSGGGVSHAAAMAAAVLDKRIVTARQFPRSISRFKNEATDLLASDIETARSAEYSKPVGSGSVRGPSVRLTEIASLCWTNLEVEICEPMVSDWSVTVQAFAWDLERNIRMPGIATTSILKSDGKTRYQPHMVEVAIVATAAKARRNAILAVIPRAYVNDLLEVARSVALKNQKPLEEVRESMLVHFARAYKVDAVQIFAYLRVNGIDDINQEGIEELRAVFEALKEGENPEAYFGKAKSKVELAKEKAAARRAKDEPAKTTVGKEADTEQDDAIAREQAEIEAEEKAASEGEK